MYSRTNPFRAEVLENINLNGRGSNKETRTLSYHWKDLDLHLNQVIFLESIQKMIQTLVEIILKEMKWDPEETRNN